MSNDVSTPSPAQVAMVEAAHPVRTLVKGTKAMRAAGETYLPKNPAETMAAYEARKKRSFLFNATGKTVIDMTGKVFDKPIVHDKITDADLVTWLTNIDNAGRDINGFGRDVFFDSMQPGIGFILVDMPPAVARADGQPATLADERRAGIRPYLKFIPIENLIGWKSTTTEGAEVLTQIRIKECATETDPDNPWQDKDVDQIRVIARGDGTVDCTWETWRETETSGKKQWAKYAGGTISQPEIQLFPVYINRDDFMKACPPLDKLAEKNIEHWQSSSEQRNILHIARVPLLFGAGFMETDKIEIGVSEMIQSSNPQAKLEFVEHTGAAINAGDKDLQNLELQMQAMGLQLLIDKPGQSATGEVRDDAKENSPLAMAAKSLEVALTQAVQSMARFGKKPEPKIGDIVVNKDFGITGNGSDFQFLTQAMLGGKLDVETWIDEAKRRGIMQGSVDPEVVLARVQAMAPELGSNVPPGKGMPLQ